MTSEQNSSQPQPQPNPDPANGSSPVVSVVTTSSAPPSPPTSESEPIKVVVSSPLQDELESMQNAPSNVPAAITILSAIAIMILALSIDNIWLGYISALVAFATSLRIFWPSWGKIWTQVIPPTWRTLIIASLGFLASIVGLLILSSAGENPTNRTIEVNWDIIGALGELIGALGQILIAVLAVYVAWRQYVISRDLTIQQNRITQQQTIDAYFQGISDLALGDQGMLEDWPQERVIAEGRTSAILNSVDAEGKAKVLRFLSQAKLITPLQRDRHLGRPILDGNGHYAEDRAYGVRVIDLGAMLAGANMANMDLRRTDLSDTNLVKANLQGCDLVRANLSRAILYEADLSKANLRSAILFYGSPETASPRSRTHIPDYTTGEHTGAVVEGADFTRVENLSEENRYYCCAWCGAQSRKTIPGGCEGIPNKLGR